MIWGSNVLVTKAMIQYVPSFFLASIRLWITCCILFCFCMYYKQPILKTEKKHLFIISFFSIVLNLFFTYLGIEYMGGTSIACINGLLPFISLLFLKQRWNPLYHTISFLCLLLSLFLTVEAWSVGFLYLILAQVCSAIGSVYIQKNGKVQHQYSFNLQYQWIGAIFLSFISIFLESNQHVAISEIPLSLFFIFFIISGFGFCFIQITYVQAIEKLGSVQTNYYLGLNPIFTFLFSIYFYQEYSMKQLVSLLFLGVSIYFGSRIKQSNKSIRK